MSRITILTLYKSKLKICRKMGYQYGNWNNKFVCDLSKIQKKKIRDLVKKGNLGDFIWNNVRMAYKICMNINNFQKQEESIDYGFERLKNINYLLYEYKAKVSIRLLK